MSRVDLVKVLGVLDPVMFGKNNAELLFGAGTGDIDVNAFVNWLAGDACSQHFQVGASGDEMLADLHDVVGPIGVSDHLFELARSRFEALDTNSNGTLSAKELEGFCKWVFSEFGRSFGSEKARQDAVEKLSQRFMKRQSDGGEWTFETFSDYFLSMIDASEKYAIARGEAYAKGYDKSAAAAKFRMLDADDNGYLEGAEIVAFAEWVYTSFRPNGQPMSDAQKSAEAQKLLRRLDENKGNADGRLSFAEVNLYIARKVEELEVMKRRRRTREEREEGAAELAEFSAFLSHNATERVLDLAVVQFDSLDDDKSGTLESKELVELATWVFDRLGRTFANDGERRQAIAAHVQRFLCQRDSSWTLSTFSDYFRARLAESEKLSLARSRALAKSYDRQAAAATFGELDGDGDGLLVGAEVLAFAEWIYRACRPNGKEMPQEQIHGEAKRLLRRLDEAKESAGGGVSFARLDAYITEIINKVEVLRQRQTQRLQREESAVEITDLQHDSYDYSAMDSVLEKAVEQFGALDKNGNGTLSGQELEGLCARVFSEFGRSFNSERERKRAVDLQVQRFLKKTPEGGEWTFATFRDYFSSMLEASEKYQLKRNEAYASGYNHSEAAAKFKELDVDGNNYLEGVEIVAFAEWIHNSFHPDREPMSEEQKQEEAQKLLARLDERRGDSDGRLSFAEVDFYIGEKIRQVATMRTRLKERAAKSAAATIAAEVFSPTRRNKQ